MTDPTTPDTCPTCGSGDRGVYGYECQQALLRYRLDGSQVPDAWHTTPYTCPRCGSPDPLLRRQIPSEHISNPDGYPCSHVWHVTTSAANREFSPPTPAPDVEATLTTIDQIPLDGHDLRDDMEAALATIRTALESRDEEITRYRDRDAWYCHKCNIVYPYSSLQGEGLPVFCPECGDACTPKWAHDKAEQATRIAHLERALKTLADNVQGSGLYSHYSPSAIVEEVLEATKDAI